MNNLLQRSIKPAVFSAFCCLFFCITTYADNGNNPCVKYTDPQMQAKCVNFLNAAASSSQNMVDRYKIAPPVTPPPVSVEQGQNQPTSAVTMEVTVPVQQPAQQDTSTMTPWQILQKGHGKAIIQSPSAPVESSASSTTPNHVNIYK